MKNVLNRIQMLSASVAVLCAFAARASTLRFDGISGQVIVGSQTQLKITGHAATWEAWINPQDTAAAPGMIMNKEGEYEFYRLNGAFWWAIANTSPGWASSNTGVPSPSNQWMHVAFAYDGATMKLYTNGVLASSQNATGNIGDGVTSLNDFRIGVRQSGPGSFFRGQIDEVRVWNVTRTGAEIAQWMSQPLTGQEAGLLAYYRLNEGAGIAALDATGQGLNGLLTGGVTWNDGEDAIQPVVIAVEATGATTNAAAVTGWVGPAGGPATNHFEYGPGSTALQFHDASQDYVEVDNSPAVANQSFSVELWARRARSKANDFFLTLGSSTSANNRLHLGFRSNDQITFAFYGDDLNVQAGGEDLRWHHWAFTYDNASRQRKMYRDGVLVGQDTATGPLAAAGPLMLGQHVGYFFNGYLDEIRFWTNVVLTPQTIQAWMFKEVDNTHPDFASLDGYWKFNDGPGSAVAADSSGRQRDGTLINDPVWLEQERPTFTQSTSPTPVSGTNSALNLDGTSGYVDVPDGVWFDGDFTVEFKAFVRRYSPYASFLDFGNGPGSDNILISLTSAGGNFQLWSYTGRAGSVLSSSTPVPTNQWVDLAVSLQGAQASLYINGTLQARGNVFAPLGVLRTNDFLGRPNWSSDTYPDVLMDEVRIWNLGRGVAQIRDDMNQIADPADPSLVLNYRFDQSSGSTVVDSRANSPQSGMLVNGANRLPMRAVANPLAGLVPGTRYYFRNTAASASGSDSGLFSSFATPRPGRGTALEFDGLNDQVTGIVPQLPTGNSAYTIEAWIKPNVMNGGGIVGWGNYGTDNQVNALRLYAGGIHVYWWYNDLDAPVGSLTDGWHHVATTFDGTVRKIFVDGVLRAAANASGHNVTTTGNFAIGKTYSSEYFDGQIDEVRIWNIARTDEQIAQFMNERLNGNEGGLVLYTRMDEGAGTVTTDDSANSNRLLLVGQPEWIGSRAGVGIPLATTLAASAIGYGSATLNGVVNLENSQPSRYWFEFGAAGALSQSTPEQVLPSGASLVNVTQVLTNLDLSPSYNFRLVAANDQGTNYGDLRLFVMPVPAARTALVFDGANAQVIVGSSTAYKATTNVTVEAWIYPTGPGPGGDEGGIIVNKEGEYEFARFGDGTLRWAMDINAPNHWIWVNTGIVAPLNQWMHVAFVYDGANVALYTNGQLAASQPATGVIQDFDSTRNDLRIGSRQAGGQFWQGVLDDVRVWLVARSTAEIQANFNRRLLLPQTGLAAWLTFDDGMGLTATNLANNTLATLSGGPVWVPSGAGIIDPIVTTLPPSPVLATSAILRGSVNPSGEGVVTYFEWGPTVAYGETTVSANYPGSLATLPLNARLTGLEPGTTYHYRMVAYNTVITNTGEDAVFTTLVLGSGWPVSTKLTGGEASAPVQVMDGLGNSYVAGIFSGSAAFRSPLSPSGGAAANAFVGKLSRTADWLWAINIPSSANGFTRIRAIGVDSGRNVYVAGQFSGTNTFGATQLVSNGDTNFFVARLDKLGTNWVWARGVGGAGVDSVNALAVIGTNVVVAGSFSGTADFTVSNLVSAGGSDVFVAALDLNGNWLWANRGGGPGDAVANTLAADANSNLYVAGDYAGSASFGSTALTNAGGTDLFVAKATPGGAWLFARRGGSANNDTAAALTRDAASQFYLVGQFGGTSDYGGTVNNLNLGNSTNIFVLKLNTEALYLDYTQGGPGNARAVTVDSLNRVYVAGDFNFVTSFGSNSLISAGNSDVFLAQLVGGNWTWAQQIGSAGAETAGAVTADADNTVVVSGTYQGTIQIGYVALSTPNNRDIFIARIDANRVFEHNNYIVGQPIPVPVDAQDPAYGDGAIGQPTITILEKDQADSDALNSFVWGLAEHKLYPVRQVTAILKWPLTTDSTNTTAVVTAVGRVFYPTNPVIHVANAPAELEPAVTDFPLKFLTLAFSTISGASVDASTKVFTAPSPGWSVLQFLDTGGELPNPTVHPSKFEVVRTVNWNDPQYLVDNQPAQIGQALTFPGHTDPTGKNGFVYFESAFYDGAGDERAYDRSSRSGPIIPVNKDTASPTDDLVVVWYRVSPNGIAWPGTPVRYLAAWPANPDELVLASGLGSGLLDPLQYPSKRVYNQPDKTLPGFNPNEEHAALYGDTLFALRNDLNDVISPKASEPYTLLKYRDPGSSQWAMKVFKVVTTNSLYQFSYGGIVGSELSLPEPLPELGLCSLSNRVVSGPGFQDYAGRIYARAAGPGNSGTNIVVRYWYPLQPGFFYDLNLDGVPDAPEGACVPWLDRRPGGLVGTPVDVNYNVIWPAGVPSLQIGETLVNAKFGLPDLRHFASASVIFDQGNSYGTNALQSLVRLFDPLSERTVQLAGNFTLPAEIQTVNDAGRLVFSGLPYVLRSRLRYDSLNKRLSFGGLLNESVDYGGPDDPLLLLNVLTPRERDRIKQLSSDPAFQSAIDNLYDLTRNPNQLDADGDGQPDRALLIGLAYAYKTNQTTLQITTNIAPEKLADGPKALTAGPGTGTGYVTVVENNDSGLGGLPVTLHVIQVADGPFRGDLKVLYPDNVFDEKLTLRHSGDFGAEPQRFEFQWYYKADAPDFDRTDLPLADANGNITDLQGWTAFPGVPTGTNGFNDITIGDGGQASILTLADNWFVCRYRGYSINGQTNWSDWAGAIGGGEAQLAEGWVKRVVFGLNPFEARTAAFHENATVTFASMLQQAGPPYEGDIAFNPAGDNINNIGLIQAYETVLHRAERLSIDATPGINYPDANNALLLAAGRIADFYMLLGNEAYADAADPTIGFRTDSAGYGALAPSIFAFQNQLDSLLEEEMALLRGRDDTSATVRSGPVYNRLFWNFTHDQGEVAYAQAYNITDQNGDGFINADDARIMYPQGHGDAWGHYLTATKTYYSLLRNTNFDWIPRSESILLAGVPVQVDYLDERKFARAAAAKAKTGAEIVDLTYRANYVDDPAGQWQGYKDTDPDRAWGLSGWAHRAGSGAFFDWVTANAILPATDPNTNHTGIQKIDRTTVPEIGEINSGYDAIQAQVDKADDGLNPLGLAKNSLPFDIDPSQIDAGKTHFEQIYDRAIDSMQNAVTVFNYANQLSQALRSLQDSVNNFSQNVDQQERDYKNRMIEIFGYPYAGDIGPGQTYPSGYDGPDLYHYMYVNAVDLNGDTAPPSQSFTAFFSPMSTLSTNVQHFFPEDAPGLESTSLDTSNILAISYPKTTADFGFVAPPVWGTRRAPGEIQMALSDLLQSQARLTQALINYDNLIKQIDDQIDLLQARYDLQSDTIEIRDKAKNRTLILKGIQAAAKITAKVMDVIKEHITDHFEAVVEGIPKSVGTATDAFAPLRGALIEARNESRTPFSIAGGIAEGAVEGADALIDHVNEQADLEIEDAQYTFEIQQRLKALEELVRQEAVLRATAAELAEKVNQNAGRYDAAVAKGLRLADERVAFRKNAAAQTQASRYQDMTFRIFRNDAIQKYRAQFDLAARYVYLAAVAYDFETQLLGGKPGAGREFLTDIVRQRALGEMLNGLPIAGQPGLADPLARLEQNFAVLKGQLGFNNPQTETGRFSLRSELFRLRSTSDEQWRVELKKHIVANLWDIPEFRRYCRPFAPESAGPQPGIVIRFPTTVTFGLNYFGWPLGGGDSAYDSTLFATKVRSAGVWFTNYPSSGLSQTPRVYLVPVGADVLRSPSGNNLETRQWRVVDQKIPVPFPIGVSTLNDPSWIPMDDSLSDTFADIRRFSSFRAYHDSGDFTPAETISDSRLIGRSVWNTDWMLIIPGGTFLFDPNQGLDAFINSVSDIKIFFQTYAYSGN